jgi:hypothetical protein
VPEVPGVKPAAVRATLAKLKDLGLVIEKEGVPRSLRVSIPKGDIPAWKRSRNRRGEHPMMETSRHLLLTGPSKHGKSQAEPACTGRGGFK